VPKRASHNRIGASDRVRRGRRIGCVRFDQQLWTLPSDEFLCEITGKDNHERNLSACKQRSSFIRIVGFQYEVEIDRPVAEVYRQFSDPEGYIRLINETIAALSPVEDKEVQAAIKELDEAATYYINRSPVASGEEIGLANKCQTGIKLIERLWRERHGLEQTIEGLRLDNDEIPKLQARIEELEAKDRWIPVGDPVAPPEGQSLLLFNPEWIDEDFNPTGVREGFCGPDNWFSAFWFDYQDCYETDTQPPTHWKPVCPPQEKDH